MVIIECPVVSRVPKTTEPYLVEFQKNTKYYRQILLLQLVGLEPRFFIKYLCLAEVYTFCKPEEKISKVY